MRWINISIDDELHYDVRNMAARAGITMKALIVKAIEEMVRKQGQKEREEGK